MIVLVRQGPAYGPEYVTALLRQIDEPVVTLTDQGDTPGETRPLRHGLKGWWAKLELFAPENADLRPFLYLDLDSFVFGPLEKFKSGPFTMVEDFNNWVPANSCVMWVPRDVDHIWTAFQKDPDAHMSRAGGRGDQYFLGDFAERLLTIADGIVSYKRHGAEGPVGTIMQFHGRPKPPEVKDGWVRDRWLTLTS